MEIKEIHSTVEFEKMIHVDGLVLIDFNAPWCAPCQMQEPILEALADEYKGKVRIAGMNIDGHPDLARELGIQSIPTLILFKASEEIQRFIGLHAKNVLAELITREMN